MVILIERYWDVVLRGKVGTSSIVLEAALSNDSPAGSDAIARPLSPTLSVAKTRELKSSLTAAKALSRELSLSAKHSSMPKDIHQVHENRAHILSTRPATMMVSFLDKAQRQTLRVYLYFTSFSAVSVTHPQQQPAPEPSATYPSTAGSCSASSQDPQQAARKAGSG